MDVLNKNELKGYYIVMKSAPIHKLAIVRNYTEVRDINAYTFHPVPRFLNHTIERLWPNVKYGVKRHQVDGADILTPHIVEAFLQITLKGCQGWVRRSVPFFESYLKQEVFKFSK